MSQTLQERLRGYSVQVFLPQTFRPMICDEAAAALDSRDAEIARLEESVRFGAERIRHWVRRCDEREARIAVLETALREIGNLSDAEADHSSTIVRDALDG